MFYAYHEVQFDIEDKDSRFTIYVPVNMTAKSQTDWDERSSWEVVNPKTIEVEIVDSLGFNEKEIIEKALKDEGNGLVKWGKE